MATGDSNDFDPRFNPAFQRGFDGAGPATEYRAPAPRAAERVYDAPVTRTAVPATAVAAQVAMPPAAGAPAQPQVRPVIQEQMDATTQAAPVRRFNPFLVALAAVSVALVAGGAWGVQVARAPFLQTNASAGTDFVGLQMLILFAPLAIILGIATAVGIAFFYAAEWQRHR
jgi:hypothetical protein